MDPWHSEQSNALQQQDPELLLVVLSFLGEAARRGSWDLTPLVGLLADLLVWQHRYVPSRAAGVLRQIAQYRKGDIGAATRALAAALTAENQELRKESGMALVEAAENGPGVGDARELLLPLLTHKMKHVRQLAADALAADAVDRMDADALVDLARHPRADVRGRALSYLVRGGQWRYLVFAAPLLCDLFREGDLDRRRAVARAMEALLLGPRDAQAPAADYVPPATAILAATEGVAMPELENARAWAERRLAEHAEAPHVRALLNQLHDPDQDPDLAPEDVTAVARLAYQHDVWAALDRLLRHRSQEVRRATLWVISVDAIRRMRSSTPIVPAVTAAMDDPATAQDAFSALQSFALFGSATQPTDLSAAHHALVDTASGAGATAESAATLLGVAQHLGGLPGGSDG
jgi:hypothetical protein